jgi:hypothetical protein
MQQRHFTTTKQIVDFFGGIDAVCEMCNVDDKTVYHWIGRSGTFPARFHDLMTKALKKRGGYTAPSTLWNQQQENAA